MLELLTANAFGVVSRCGDETNISSTNVLVLFGSIRLRFSANNVEKIVAVVGNSSCTITSTHISLFVGMNFMWLNVCTMWLTSATPFGALVGLKLTFLKQHIGVVAYLTVQNLLLPRQTNRSCIKIELSFIGCYISSPALVSFSTHTYGLLLTGQVMSIAAIEIKCLNSSSEASKEVLIATSWSFNRRGTGILCHLDPPLAVKGAGSNLKCQICASWVSFHIH